MITASRARQRVLAFACSLAGVTYLDRVCISAAAPAMMKDLDLSVWQMSVVFSAFTLAYSLFEVPSGWLGGVLGPRRVLTRIVLWWSAFTMLTGAAWSFLSLVVLRFAFGAGEAGAFPNASVVFARWFPPHERGRANGVLFLGSRLGGAVAPLLAIFVIQLLGWRMSFVVFGVIGIVWAVWWARWFRDDPADHPSVNAAELAWIRQSPRAETANAPVPWAALRRHPNLYAICGMYFAFGYGLYFYFTWLPTYLIQVLGFSAFAGGLFSGLPFVLAGLANVLGGLATDRLARTNGLWLARSGLGSASFATCGALVLASVVVTAPAAKAIFLALALAAADFGLAACWAVCLDVGEAHVGVITGFMNTAGNFGGFLAPLVLGYLVQERGSWTIPFYLTAAIYVMGAALWLLVDPTQTIRLADDARDVTSRAGWADAGA